jgi:alpha-mannosidase
MDEFPEYHFTQSQPQLYDFVRQDHPALFDAIKARVKDGRWEPVGGMWVEADCNLSGAEALARQFLLGRRFFREHFGLGAESPVLWLPDVFGYAWSLPQLLKQAGLEYFFTVKLSWNQTNRMPFHSFWWQGLDGTRVLTHFSPTPEPEGGYGSTYSAELTPGQALGAWRNHQPKDLVRAAGPPPMLMAFGYGDGGGGPTREMLENARELAAFPALPRVKPGTAREFFRRLEAEAGPHLPTWSGELSLELHRGTYTTQSRTKRANRQSEFLLHDAEFLAACAATLAQHPYPADQLNRAWELVCLNQFHDIIPGSSIRPVYAEAEQHYAEVRRAAEAVRAEALDALAGAIGADLLVVNPTSFTRRDLAFYAGDPALLPADVAAQPVEGGAWLDVGAVPPYSLTPLTPGLGRAVKPAPLSISPRHLENQFLRVELDEAGDLVRVYDKRHAREVLAPGARANQFQAFEDRPLEWDAWDIDVFYDDRQWLAAPAESVRVVETGPLRAALEIRRRILNSPFTQRIALAHNSPRLDFDTVIDWRERHVLLKTAFPVDVLAPAATYEIQWGSVQRPTHRNTSWDWARFETCAHKWVDLSEGGYGVSLLNDCKYGHDIHGHVIRLTLLRSPTLPDPEADQGEHRFSYSLLPHAGPWEVETLRQAYALNDPLIVHRAPGAARASDEPVAPFVQTDPPNVVIETVKRAEAGEGVIVRLYEAMRRRGPVTVTTGFPLKAAWRTNLLEEDQSPLETDGRDVKLAVRPFEIVTVRLVPA